MRLVLRLFPSVFFLSLLVALAGASSTSGSNPAQRFAPLQSESALKLKTSDAATAAALAAGGAELIADYGSFQIFSAAVQAESELTGPGLENVTYENSIELNAGAVDTRATAARQARASATTFAGKQLHLVQFAGPVKPDWFQALEKTRVQVVDYIPNNAYLVYGDAAALQKVQELATSLPAVQFHGAFLNTDKIHPTARVTVSKRAAAAPSEGLYQIQMVADATANADTLAVLDALKLAPIVRQSHSAKYLNVVVKLSPDALDGLSAQPDIISIWPYVTPKKFDERQGMIVAGNLSGNVPSGAGYLDWLASKGFTQAQFDTSGLLVDVTDSGVDNGTSNANHFALYRGGTTSDISRVRYNRLEGTANAGSTLQGCDGHGNLNTHIISGYVSLTNFPHTDSAGYRYGLGIAPFVRVGSSVIFDPSNFTSPNYEDLASRAYRDGARVSGNSWGADTAGGYDVDAQQYDAIVRDAQQAGSAVPNAGNQEMTFVFAAGNAGSAAGTVGSPGTAKNVITVGAAENVHSHSSTNGGNVASGNDGCSTPDSEANSANDVATFSSRGPCADSRKKPEIMAPGTHITGGVGQSVRTMSGNGTAIACFDGTGVCALPGGGTAGSTNNFFPQGQKWYTTSSGTSHSTPCVAGGAALIYQWFLNNFTNAPSPAMIKAFLMNAARYMNGTGANDALYSNNQGMGMMNLGTAFDGTPRFLRDQLTNDLFTASGQTRTFTGVIVSNSKPVRITLTWTDAPGSTSGNAYNNNLDLVVVVNGTTYRGNVFSGQYSTTGGSADPRDNAESVFLPAGTTGSVAITISGTGINSDGVPNYGTALDQDFALVAYNIQEAQAPAIASAGSQIAVEGCGVGNGALDPDETVTVNFALRNAGTANTTNVVATLLATGGVTAPSSAQSYGALLASGAAVTNAFTFTSTGTCGGTVTATLSLADGSTDLGTVMYTFTLGGTTVATVTNNNAATITINDNAAASPYPSSITISGLAGTVSKVVATLQGFTHSYPSDVDIILVGPGGQKVALMGGAGGGTAVNNLTLTFDDSAASQLGTPLTSGTWQPSGSVASMPGAAPAAPYGTSLADFIGSSPNGTWSIYVADAAAQDTGTIASGWKLAITAAEPLCCGSNKPPILSAIGDKSVTVSNSLTFAVTATDPYDSDPITLVASNLPGDATFGVTNGNGTFLWTNAAPTGTYSVVFHASDKDGFDAETISITVNPVPVVDTNCAVIISEYVEGSSNNKAIELFNPGASAINLAAGAYYLQAYFNGSVTPTSLGLTGTIAAASTFVIANNSAGTGITARANLLTGSTVLTYNGDDAIVLRSGGATGTVLDSIGQVGTDPGTEWGSGLTSTADNTIRRKGTVSRGDTITTDAFTPATEWDGFATDTFTGLGSHTNICTGGGSPSETPPVLSPLGTQSVLLSNTMQFAVIATPTDGDPVTLSASNLPAGAVFGATNELGSFLWTNASPLGTYTSTFYATDNDGTVSQAVTIIVGELSLNSMETFSNLNATASTYGNGDYVGDNGITWYYNGARKADSANYIDGQAIGFGDSTRTSRQVYCQSIPGGVGSLSFKYLKYFTGAGTRSFDIYVNTQLVGTVSDANNTSVQTQSIAGINISGDVVIRIVGTGSKQFLVDSLAWTGFSGSVNPDTDADGIDDAWELGYFGSLTNVNASSDWDNDGFLDLYEFLAGSIPTNGNSLLEATATATESSGGFVVTWQSESNKSYTLARSTNLLEGFTGIASNILAVYPLNTYTDAANTNATSLYRVELE